MPTRREHDAASGGAAQAPKPKAATDVVLPDDMLDFALLDLGNGDAGRCRKECAPRCTEADGVCFLTKFVRSQAALREARRSAQAKQGYDPPPPYEPAEPDDFITVTAPSRAFAPPEKIAALYDARRSGRGWKKGRCPICNERELAIGWGRHRDRTMVHCYACHSRDVVKEISKRHRVSLEMRPSSLDRSTHRRFNDTKGMTPVERALWHCTKIEQRLYEHFKQRGDGAVRYEDMPNRRSAKRGVPVLEHLGLVKATRGRFDPYQGCRPTSLYEVARLKLHCRLEPDDRKLKADLKAIRKGGRGIEQPLKQNLKDASEVNTGGNLCKRSAKMAPIRTLWEGRGVGPHGAWRVWSKAEVNRRRRVAREAGGMAFAEAMGRLAAAHGGSWGGTWRALLAALVRPDGSRGWPRSKGGVQSRLYHGRAALAALGLVAEWHDRVRVRIVPVAPASSAVESFATGLRR
jgi:hypothetical protein